jgi:hypothetical protein
MVIRAFGQSMHPVLLLAGRLASACHGKRNNVHTPEKLQFPDVSDAHRRRHRYRKVVRIESTITRGTNCVRKY